MSRALHIQSAGQTDRGRLRPFNEDRFLADDVLGLYLVADGVGGRPLGDVAAELAVAVVQRFLADPNTTWPPDAGPAPHRLVAAFKAANQEIHRQGKIETPGRSMAATLVGAFVEPDGVIVAHVGDSRAYRLRGRRLERLTEDHTLIHDLLWKGMPFDQADAMPQKNALTRVLGLMDRVDVTVRVEPLLSGDVLLLCTDGLSKVVALEEMAGILVEGGELSGAIDRLIARANERGGPDNITAVLVRASEPA